MGDSKSSHEHLPSAGSRSGVRGFRSAGFSTANSMVMLLSPDKLGSGPVNFRSRDPDRQHLFVTEFKNRPALADASGGRLSRAMTLSLILILTLSPTLIVTICVILILTVTLTVTLFIKKPGPDCV